MRTPLVIYVEAPMILVDLFDLKKKANSAIYFIFFITPENIHHPICHHYNGGVSWKNEEIFCRKAFHSVQER